MFFRIWNGCIDDETPEYSLQLVRVIEKNEIALIECISHAGKPELKYVLWKNLAYYEPIGENDVQQAKTKETEKVNAVS